MQIAGYRKFGKWSAGRGWLIPVLIFILVGNLSWIAVRIHQTPPPLPAGFFSAAELLTTELGRHARVLSPRSRIPPHGSPVAGPVSSGYGMRFHPSYRRWKPHRGVDLAVPVGTPVMVTADGWVSRVDRDGDGYGLFLVVVHPGSGYQTLYAHLSSVLVRVGMPVRRGQVIARSGISGNAVGAHLHYEVKTRNGRHVDPLKVRLERGKAGRGG